MKGFRIVDESKGIFELYDRSFEKFRKWKLYENATPGMWMAQERLEKARPVSSIVPNHADLTAEELNKAIKAKMNSVSPEEAKAYSDAIRDYTSKQIAIMCTYIEPVDTDMEGGRYAGIWETKIEFLASCLSNNGDVANIQNFFFKFLSDSTT